MINNLNLSECLDDVVTKEPSDVVTKEPSDVVSQKDGYYVGLDIGTGSCGWAVTDLKYQVLKKSKKRLWGVRLFPTADTAAERRTFRCTRRRLQRRNWRLNLLKGLFEAEINKVDPAFFMRMKESMLQDDDRTTTARNALFADENYKDKNYAEEYPTIYHLRLNLMEKAPKDIRLLYLAIHHILKHRGHFLFENFNVDNISGSFETIWRNVSNIIVEKVFLTPDLESESIDDDGDDGDLNNNAIERLQSYGQEVLQQLLSLNRNRTDVKKRLSSIFEEALGEKADKKKKKSIEQCVAALVGAKFKPFVCVSDDEPEEEQLKIELCFSSASYETDFATKLGSTQQSVFAILKEVYDFVRLQNLLGGRKSISEAKVEMYKEHSKDLIVLKDLIRNSDHLQDNEKTSLYNNVFKKYDAPLKCVGECLYETILRYRALEIKSTTNKDLAPAKALYGQLMEIAQKFIEMNAAGAVIEPEILKVCNRIVDGTIFSHAVSVENSVIPQQLHAFELKKILENAKAQFPFLNESDEFGTVVDKIIKLHSFRIPYYVGPVNNYVGELNNSGNKHAWCVKNEGVNLPYTPWTFHKIVDTKKSAQEFINRMTSKCTYLRYADVLPKCSILYSEFEVLQELNNIRFNGRKLKHEQISLLIEELYKKDKNVSLKKLKNLLVSRMGFSREDVEVVSGIDMELKGNMASYVQLNELLKTNGIQLKDEKQKIDVMEQIVLWVTIFEDAKVLKDKLSQELGYLLNDKVINSVVGLRFAAWGRLSREFLENVLGRVRNDKLDIPVNIMTRLRKGEGNLMMLLSDAYTYSETVAKLNEQSSEVKKYDSISYDMVDELYVSPSVKRMIWQSLKVVDEIVNIMGGVQPKKIFVEMARGEEKKPERTVSRKKYLQDLYQNCRKQEPELAEQLDKVENSSLLNERLYLYYTQFGRCMYSGEAIDLEKLFDSYDVDHIYPRCYVKDDSLDNKVLVKRTLNGIKSKTYPLGAVADIAKNFDVCRPLWTKLRDNGLISNEKYKRLIRTTEFTQDELQSFVARQLVETRQSTKEVCNLLKQVYKDSRVVYSKAGNVSDFRHKFSFIKVRELNCLHHAKDAYLNIVVGNVFDEKFCHGDIRKFFSICSHNEEGYTFREGDTDVFSKPGDRLKKLGVWSGPEQIGAIRKQYRQNDIFVTELQEIRSGQFFDMNLSPKEAGLIPPKDIRVQTKNELVSGEILPKTGLDTSKYGGYKGASTSYFAFIEYTEKNKVVRSFAAVPVYINSMKGNLKDNIKDYLVKNGYASPKVLISQLKMPFFLRDNKTSLTFKVSGVSDGRLLCGLAEQLTLSEKDTAQLKKVVSFLKKLNEDNSYQYSPKFAGFSDSELNELLNILKWKITNTKFKNISDKVTSLLEATQFDENLVLSIPDKAKLVMNLVGIFENRDHSNDLSLIGGKKQMGRLLKSIKPNGDFSIVYQSVTGFYVHEIKLNELK